MNATGKRRLLKLADFLAKLPRSSAKAFDMSTLSEVPKDGRPACGTSACALGWATAVPSFRKAGLHLTRGGGVRLKGTRTKWYIEVAMGFFDLEYNEARHLFSMREKPSESEGATARRAAVKRIRDLVKEKENVAT